MVYNGTSYSHYSNKDLISAIIFGGAAASAIAYFYWTSSNNGGSNRNRIIPGLVNQGNTCYANSLLQALASCPSFVGWLKNIDTDEAGLRGGFIEALKKIIIGLNESSESVLNAGDIVRSLSAHGWKISIGVEHDLYELFNVFVSTWDEELKIKRMKISNQSIEICQDPKSSKLNNLPRKLLQFEKCASLARIDAKIRSPCVGMTATQYRCCNSECGYRTIKYESFTALTLSIPNSTLGTNTSLDVLLRRYFCSEIIRDATCDKCKAASRKQQGFFKKHGIVKLPQTLLIRIERVGMLPSGSLKLNEHVAFGECLSLQDVTFRKNPKINQLAYENSKKWQLPDGTSRVVGGAENVKSIHSPLPATPNRGYHMEEYAWINGGSFVSERKEAQKYAYQLRAVSEHRGGPYSGHFVTYRRAPQPNHYSWFCTNDSVVTRTSYANVSTCQGYMLFYERIRPHRFYDR